MNKVIARYGLAVIAVLFSLVPAYFILITPIYLAWCFIWACCFAFLVNNQSLLVRGFLFLTSSIALGLLGVAYAKAISSEYLWAAEFISQIIVLVGAGVGGNFIAVYFLNR